MVHYFSPYCCSSRLNQGEDTRLSFAVRRIGRKDRERDGSEVSLVIISYSESRRREDELRYRASQQQAFSSSLPTSFYSLFFPTRTFAGSSFPLLTALVRVAA